MMNFIQAGRRWGKTRRAVSWLTQGRVVDGQWNRLLICVSTGEARRIVQEYGVPKQFVMDLEEWRRSEMRGRGYNHDLEIMVDDADQIVKEALRLHPGIRLAGITWNDDEEKFTGEDFWREERFRNSRERVDFTMKPKKARADRLDDQFEITAGQDQLPPTPSFPSSTPPLKFD